MFSFFFSLFIYRRFVCGYPWCVSYPALPSGCRNIVFLRNCGLRLKFHHLSPCFKYEFCSSYFSFFPFSRTRILISFCSLLFCFFFCSFPYPIRPSLPSFTLIEQSFEELAKILPIKKIRLRGLQSLSSIFFFFEISKTGRLFARLYRI